MATDRSRDKRRTKPWAARRRMNGVEVSLGYYATRREAERAEAEFDLAKARQVVAELERLLGERDTATVRATLEQISLLALEANEEYESSCRRKVDRIRSLAQNALMVLDMPAALSVGITP